MKSWFFGSAAGIHGPCVEELEIVTGSGLGIRRFIGGLKLRRKIDAFQVIRLNERSESLLVLYLAQVRCRPQRKGACLRQ